MSTQWDADRFIDGKLRADATLMGLVGGIYNTIAPEGAGYPLVLFTMQQGGSLQTANAIRVFDDLLYLVRVIGETNSYGAIDAAVARVETLLHRASGVAGSGQALACTYERPFSWTEVAAGRMFRHRGGFYRVLVQ